NVIAFSTALRETGTANILAELQAPEGSVLAGGFHYVHEPTIAETYYAVHSVDSLLIGPAWNTWVTENNALVQSVLETLEVDLGSETGYMTSESDTVINCRSTGQGLWLIETMDLSGSFNVPEIVSYLTSRQDADGGFENSITSTFHVAEALYTSGNLGSINTVDLENWLRSLVIDGSKTSDPDLWGAIGANPTSLSPTNDYAVKYLRSLQFIGKAHPDPGKLTSWILTRTSNGDGSFQNSHNPDEEVVTGTASALASMKILGTLSPSNKTSGFSWLTNNQLASGGFGMKPKSSDLIAKTRESSRVADCLEDLSETTGVLASSILSYVDSITTDAGFETMDKLPSLMWSSWILQTARLAHASNLVDLDAAVEYLNYFEKCNVYPLWDNLTTIIPPEYGWNQYRTISVWSQYFGISVAESLGVSLSSDVIVEVTQFLSQAQWVTGHYRPATMSGTAHMQHSVAAVEALYLLDGLDTIPYRSILESAILSEYSSGSWDSTGWTLEPFARSQEAIDFLSTRAALRLGIVSAAMASEITTAIEARIQYTDLLALSYDVATLSLLNGSSFATGLESIDRSQVLNALESHFTAGWYNSTTLRQPVYTTAVLEMVSILGLRSSMTDIPGTMVIASSSASTSPGADLQVSISITSASSSHSVLVHSFGDWHLFTYVANSDTLMVPIPSSTDVLGSADIAVSVVDWGASRAFDSISVNVQGTLEGSLDLETPTVKMGDNVNGTISWSLGGGVDAGESHVTITLGAQEWTYDETSSYWFSVPTSGFDAGTYPLSVTVERPYSTQLLIADEVVIAQPNPTYISATSSLSGIVDEAVLIDWSLHFTANSSQISGQEVTLTIRDSLNSIVFTDVDDSLIGGSSFSWTPSDRDVYAFTLVFPGNHSLEGSQFAGDIIVSEYTMFT
ncbi:MAG: prenyltransferase/squalene oxidase repeat-containing protein, partial [Promethearchaeota archaeon]